MVRAPEAVCKDAVREHYDVVTPFYRMLWGEHIHHGLFESDEPQAAAQNALVERLATEAEIPRGARVLDIGCGVGGSSLWLAQHLGCDVTGITLSPVQQRIASEKARAAGVAERARFEVMDAAEMTFADASFDAVWIVECSEHLEDKARLFADCARLLRPGGKLAVCAWLAAGEPGAEQKRLVERICEGMLCPSLASMSEYESWMRDSGFESIRARDITPRVQRTWKLCRTLAKRPEVGVALAVAPPRLRRFVDAISGMDEAYASGAMAYGMFTATKKGGEEDEVSGSRSRPGAAAERLRPQN